MLPNLIITCTLAPLILFLVLSIRKLYVAVTVLFVVVGIAHHLAGLPGPPPEWAMFGGRHSYAPGPFIPHHHPHFPHHMFAALDRPVNTSPRLAAGTLSSHSFNRN